MTDLPLNSHFLAQLARMKLIERWPLMRSQFRENVAEHSLMVAMVTHLLVSIENRLFHGSLDSGHAVLMALYHDSSEVFTGDLPTPVKYASTALRDAYKDLEAQAEQRLLALLPKALQVDFDAFLLSHKKDAHYEHIVKDADVLCAYIKCLEELSAGNQEFIQAKAKLEQTLQERARAPLNYFIQTFLHSMRLSLDELS
ncbi:5'-deoxynucleotidase [Celerinatantimonas yamalensis]|uniref:5'-deoxynucleotidase n=1 Tax=Celerinatantimonas yamalensis TaxID=559956 RepID=A0ABW9G6J5_9GAMM